MLSHSYRIRLEKICEKIVNQETVELKEIIWAEKISKSNRSAASILRQARRKAENPEMQDGDLDSFLNDLDLGGMGHEGKGITGFNTVDEIVDFFKRDNESDWRTRD